MTIISTSEPEFTLTRQVITLVQEALKIGEAWTEEYLNECKSEGLWAEAERVEHGLTKIRTSLTILKGS